MRLWRHYTRLRSEVMALAFALALMAAACGDSSDGTFPKLQQ